MTLNNRQQKALASLLEGHTIRRAADQASVSVRQLYRWLDQDAFTQALKDHQQARLDTVNARLLALSSKALDTLEDVLDRPGVKGQNVARLAADTILGHALRWREMTDLERRLSAVEECLKGRKVKHDHKYKVEGSRTGAGCDW